MPEIDHRRRLISPFVSIDQIRGANLEACLHMTTSMVARINQTQGVLIPILTKGQTFVSPSYIPLINRLNKHFITYSTRSIARRNTIL